MAQQESFYYGTGRRKTATARVFLRKGDKGITVNGKALTDYFPMEYQRHAVNQPLNVTDFNLDGFEIYATVKGSGTTGQAGAMSLGIARALLQFDEDQYRPILKKAGLLTRDARQVERKKVGQPKARKKKQFSKR